jgi:hypothetical protein
MIGSNQVHDVGEHLSVKWTTSLLIFLVTATFFYFVLAYAADFPVRQSIVLALVLASFSRALEKLSATKPTMIFTPYFVRIDPKWHKLLIDFKLIATMDEWHALSASFKDLPTTEYSVLRSGVYFTILQESDDYERTLLYWGHRQTFLSEVDFEIKMEPIKVDGEARYEFQRNWTPSFFVKGGSHGYNLGLRVPDWWWEQMKASCPKPMREDKDYNCGQVNLILATTPLMEFALYHQSSDWNGTYAEKKGKKLAAFREESRVKLDWKCVTPERDSELNIVWPESIEHKYFDVRHQGI